MQHNIKLSQKRHSSMSVVVQQWLFPFASRPPLPWLTFHAWSCFSARQGLTTSRKTAGFLSVQQIFAQVKRFHSSDCWEGRPALTKQGCHCCMGRVDGGVVVVGGLLTWKQLSNQGCVYSGYSIRRNLCATSSTQWEAETGVLWLLAAVRRRRLAAGSEVHRGGGIQKKVVVAGI